MPQVQLKYVPALVTTGKLASEHKFTAGAAATGVADAAEPQIKVEGVQKWNVDSDKGRGVPSIVQKLAL